MTPSAISPASKNDAAPSKAPATDSVRTAMFWVDPPAKAAVSNQGGADTVKIVGSVSGKLQLTINIELVGNLDISTLTIERGGRVEGQIHAERVDISGEIAGDVTANFIHIRPGAKVVGSVNYASIKIEPGSIVDAELAPSKKAKAEPAALSSD